MHLKDTLARWAGAYYRLGARWRNAFPARLLQAGFIERLARRLAKSPLRLKVECFAACCLAISFFLQLAPLLDPGRGFDRSETNIALFTHLSTNPYRGEVDQLATHNTWEARLLGQILTGWTDDVAFKSAWFAFRHGWMESDSLHFGPYPFQTQWLAFGLYNALWLWLLFLLLIWYRSDALLLMLGIFAGLMFNCTLAAGRWFYPWDMPTMLLFTWACLLFERRRFWGLVLAVWLGSLFKETSLCCALLIFFARDWSWKKRLLVFGATVLAFFLARKGLMVLYGVQTLLFSPNSSGSLAEVLPRFWTTLFDNLGCLARVEPNHVLFANAGTLLVVLLLPWRTWREVAFKTVFICFVIGQFFCGVIIEMRIWFELLPLGWMLVSERLLAADSGPAKPSQSPRPSASEPSLWVGSHWLVLSMLLALTVLLLAVCHSRWGQPSRFAAAGLPAGATNAPAAGPLAQSELAALARANLKLAFGGNPQLGLQRARELVQVYPDEPIALNALAMLLATGPQPELRDGPQALALATRAVALTGGRDATHVGTLAAAQAAVGHFAQALTSAQLACQLARFNCQTQMLPVYEYYQKSFSAQAAAAASR